MKQTEQTDDSKESRRVRLGRVDSITLFEITDHELTQLEQGSPVSLLLNFALFLGGIAFSTAATLATVVFGPEAERSFYVFVIVLAVTGIAALVCIGLWTRYHKSVGDLTARIRARVREPQSGTILKAPPPVQAGPQEAEDNNA